MAGGFSLARRACASAAFFLLGSLAVGGKGGGSRTPAMQKMAVVGAQLVRPAGGAARAGGRQAQRLAPARIVPPGGVLESKLAQCGGVSWQSAAGSTSRAAWARVSSEESIRPSGRSAVQIDQSARASGLVSAARRIHSTGPRPVQRSGKVTLAVLSPAHVVTEAAGHRLCPARDLAGVPRVVASTR